MICSTVSERSLFETLEECIPADVSVSLLAEIERELLRLRSELSQDDWATFCDEFRKRRFFEALRLGSAARKRPKDVRDFALAEGVPARPFSLPSTAHLVNAWEYSLPVSRSLRARRAYFAREITETLRTAVKPRILVLGAGRLQEADHALQSRHLHHAEFIAMEHDKSDALNLRSAYTDRQLQIEAGDWLDLPGLQTALGRFDLIYSPGWLDLCDDSQSQAWLDTGAEMLRMGGRLLAANFAPGSRDAGWMEACWNWRPNYRSEEQLARVAMQMKSVNLRGHTVFRDESGASAFLEIHSL